MTLNTVSLSVTSRIVSRGLSVLLLAVLTGACSEGVSVEEHIQKARTLLEESRGQVALVRNREEMAAIAELKAALKKDRDNLEATTLLALTYFEGGMFEDAEVKLSEASELGAPFSLITPRLAEALLNSGQYARLDDLTLEGLGPEDRSIVQAARALSMIYRERVDLAEELMAAARQNDDLSPFAEVADARLTLETSGYEEAREQLQDIVERHPRYAPAWNLLGEVESMRGEAGAALRAYQTASKLLGKMLSPALNSALMRIYTGNFRRALTEVNRVEEDYPAALKNDAWRFMRAILDVQRYPKSKPRKRLEKVEALHKYPLTLYYLAALGVEEGFPEFGLSHVYEFLHLAPGSVAGTKLAARLELARGEYPRVEYILRPFVREQPDDVEALVLLARAQAGLGRQHDAINTLARVYELEPGSLQTRVQLAAAYFELGEEVLDLDVIPGFLLADVTEQNSSLASAEDPVAAAPGKVRSRIGDGPIEAEQLGIGILERILSEHPGYEPASILLVLNHLRQERLADAVGSAQAYRERSPSSATAYDLLGRAYLADGRTEMAREAFGKVLELRPGDPDAGSGLAELELLAGDFDSARNYYQRVLSYNPTHTRTGLKLAATYAEEGRAEEMEQAIQDTLVANPRAAEPHLAKVRYHLAKGELENANSVVVGITEEQKSQPDGMASMAAWELVRGRYDQALVNLRRLIRLRPDVAQYHYLRAKAYAALGDRKRMLAAIERTVELDADHFFGKVALARMQYSTGEHEEFELSLGELTRLAPDNLDVMKLQAIAAQRQGKADEALRLFEAIVRREPLSDNVIALSGHRSLQGDHKGAIARLKAWIEDHPGDTNAREKLAEVYSRSGDHDAALVQYEKILDVDPTHVAALNNMAWLLLNDDPGDAMEFAERAVRYSDKSSAVLDTLAMAQLKNGRLESARRSIDRALALSPDSPYLRFHEAQITLAEGDRDEAEEALNSLLENSGSWPERAEVESFLNNLR